MSSEGRGFLRFALFAVVAWPIPWVYYIIAIVGYLALED